MSNCASSSRRILIVKLSSIGDVVHALPAARSLRLAYPDAYLCWAVHRASRDVVEGNRYLDDTFVLEEKSLSGVIRAGRELAKRRFDVAIDMQGLFRSGLLTWLSRAPERIGFSGTQEMHHLFLTRPEIPPEHPMTAPYSQLRFALAAGGKKIEPIPEIYVSPEHQQQAADLLTPALERGGPIVALNPGAAWETKRWYPEEYAAAADALVRQSGAEIVITGGPAEADLAREIAGKMESPAVVIAGKTSLKVLAAVFERSSIYLGGDTGPMHIAAAMGTTAVIIFGPTDPGKIAPVGAPLHIIRHEVPCGPCRNRHCDHHTCMRLVTVAEVVAAARAAMAQPRRDL